ncbi:1,4-alpha-glucan branching protein GlgB [Thermomonospora curvata]|uniref:1,4-alpha-glucan branching enzyme GlgB n=1 Tax=Thermomonospora curvata (strain ATCC 19995 / DSM 43183 / JCM 3096 / KCTC 9072 / NBRC 15933 / NCIMB 10081 / Henssen B9) TaxID=471852 RepID=D1ABW4_THECD|nr:1,4-alpha-glucan branching protein GlgB [Thermomonospora curvata]ACY99137.1 1,4-alpha-glucan branching enzyme [Thermomonospora curvata DSM 43183]
MTGVTHEDLDRLVGGHHHDPHSILGAHPGPDGVVIRALRPLAEQVEAILPDGTRHRLHHVHEGVFEVVLEAHRAVPDYRLAVRYAGGPELIQDDPYRHLPTVGELDLHLFGEGRHEELWRALGARVRSFPSQFGETRGVSFTVWAPNARGVRVIGDFNHWDGRAHPMRSLGASGVWELFVPGLGNGTTYKFEVLGADGQWRGKADPMARWTEQPPATASRVFESSYEWGDGAWMEQRASRDWLHEPMSIYEVHLGSWRKGLGYRELAEELTAYVQEMGFTHVEFLPVAEHPYGPSWGYQVTSYYAPTSRFGTPDDFRHLVDRLHQAGIGVLIDWVPAHFPRDEWALARFDGTALYEHDDPRKGEHPDWGTLVFNYGRAEVRNFLVANACYWLEEFHIDGLRVDAVASMLYLDYSRKDGEWTPNVYGGRENLEAISFLQETNATVYRRYPGIITVAEESTAWPGVTRPTHLGGLGFGFKWNMGWMHDTLTYLQHDPVFRHYHHNEITFSLIYAFSENYVLPLSHDEVVHLKGSLLAKMPGDTWKKFAGLRALFAYMWAHPGKQLLFMGGEFAQGGEWAEERPLDWWLLDNAAEGAAHLGVQKLVRDLNRVYRSCPALYTIDNEPGGFHWIDAGDAGRNTLSFLRYGSDGSVLACVVNFSGSPHENYRIGLPQAGGWREIVNTDAYEYGGSGVGNMGHVTAVDEPSHAQPASAVIRVPPLGALWLVPEESARPRPTAR